MAGKRKQNRERGQQTHPQGCTSLHKTVKSDMLVLVEQRDLSKGVEVVERFEKALSDLGLTHERLSIKKYRDCIHWHIRKPGHSGTLEATYLAEGQRLWLEVRKNRSAEWQVEMIREIDASISNHQPFGGQSVRGPFAD